jgi:signal transduction histidine kinase
MGLATVLFAIGGTIAITVYHRSLTDSLQHSVAQTATTIASRATDQVLPDPIPMPVGPDIPRVQVLDSADQVIGGDPTSSGEPAMFLLAAGLRQQQAVVGTVGLLHGAAGYVYAVRIATPAGAETVVAALPLTPVSVRTHDATQATAGLCAASLVVVGVVVWLTAGRVLRPVERMRSQAAAITASGELSGRLPDSGTDELSRLSDTLNGMLGSLQSSVERQRRFVADAAHELRTPLAGLIAALEVARKHPSTATGSLVDELLEGHRRLGRTVNDLLMMAALDGQAPLRMAPVDLAGVVTDCSRRSVPDGVTLRVGNQERVVVLGNEAQLHRMVGNLIDNAVRYAASTVRVSLTAADGSARICVADDGPGVPEPDRERIWDRFVRLDNDRSREGGGSGLGLAMVRELAVAHGGTAEISAMEHGSGAEFVIRLPVPPGQEAGDLFSAWATCSGGSVASARRCRMRTAGRAPITSISASGQASTLVAPSAREFIAT